MISEVHKVLRTVDKLDAAAIQIRREVRERGGGLNNNNNDIYNFTIASFTRMIWWGKGF